MSHAAAVVWDDALAMYDFGRGHPLAPVRVELTIALARALGLLDRVDVIGDLRLADDRLLETVHTADYLAAVRDAGDPMLPRPRLDYGLGSSDNPVFGGMHEASALVVSATMAAARAVWEGRADHAVNVAGGLHHAMPGQASGFCIYNDPAIAIRWMLGQGAARIAYVDVDVHHGDGVQAVFYDDPRVLTISLHESGRTLFPGTGFPDEIGAPGAEGTSVNVALPPGTKDAAWLRAFPAVVPPPLHRFAPDILVTQHGCDSHALDPLAHMLLTVDGQRTSYAALHELAHEVCGGRWLALGGGGYELVQVVPRAWSHLIAIAAGAHVDPRTETPEAWRDFVRQRTGTQAPLRMTDGRDGSFVPWTVAAHDPDDGVDHAIEETRTAVFPCHDLDPMETA
jgi:acetoin utilization protein AcuC